MSSVIPPYASPPTIRSTLFENPPDVIPPTDELELLNDELNLLKQKAIERARKAGEDLKTIEESMRRMKEKEKGKAKASEKVKREGGSTPHLNGDETASPSQPPPPPQRPRIPPVVLTSASPAPTPVVDTRKSMPEEMKKKKKKRKREELSDAEPEPQKVRKASPVPAQSHPPVLPSLPPPKAAKYPSSSLVFSKPANGQDFALPPPTSLLPARPPLQPTPIPGPSKPTDVREDFSKSKPPGGQVQVTTFYTSIEPWIRPIKEEDVGFLEYTGDEVEPFIMPKLGRHYAEVWEEEDIKLYGAPLPGTTAMRAVARGHASSSTTSLPRWEPSTLMEADLLTEERGHGPLTERLVSALIPMHNATEWRGVKAAEEAMEGRPGSNGAAAAAARDKLNVADLEDRIKNVLRFHGLLEELPDFSEAVDDPIATALRHAQRELRIVLANNKARRARLAAIARDRLGHQEYVELRDSIDRSITTLYTKLQKRDGPKANKKKKKSVELNGAPNGALTGVSALPPCPAAIGLGPDEENRLNVPEQLNRLVQTRRQWVDTVGSVFEEKQNESPGRIWGLPRTSVYDGIDEEVRREIARNSPPGSTSNSHLHLRAPTIVLDSRTTSSTNMTKGKEKASEHDMDID